MFKDIVKINLKDFNYFDFRNGLWKGKKPPFKKVMVIRNTNFTESGKINLSNVAVLEVEEIQFKKKFLQWGDIIIERSGGGPKQPVGRVVFFDLNHGDFSFSNFTSRIRVINQLFDSKFVFYFLHNFYQDGMTEKFQAHTTGIRNLDFNIYKKTIYIPLLPLSEQYKITYLLNTVQKAIEQQDKLIHTTTELKKALMQKLFTEGIKGEPQKETEIGLVPKSWEVKKVGEITRVFSGGTPSRSEISYWENGTIPWVKTGEIDYCLITESEEKITEVGYKNSSAKFCKKGTILMAMYGQGITRGKVAILGLDATINQACAAIVPKNENQIKTKFLYYFFEKNYEFVRNFGHGANQKNISGTLIKSMEISFPISIHEQNKIVEILELLDKKKQINISKKQTLSDLFKTMLYELMTGQRRVNELEFEQ